MIGRLGALLAALFGVGLVLAAPASAHATVITSDPLDGSRLKAAPQSVSVVFDEAVGLGSVGYLHVTDASGKRVDAGAAFHPGGDATKVSDNLITGLGDSTYTASFRVVSADSHPVAGTFRFVVGNGPLVRGSVSSGPTTNAQTSLAFAISRWVSFAGLALLGGAWLVLTVWPAGRADLRARRTMWAGWIGLVAGAVFELLLQGPYAAGLGPKLFDPSLVDDTLHTSFGQLHSVRLVLLGMLGILLARSLQATGSARWELVLGLLGLGVLWTFSGAGHAATTPPSWLSTALDMAHLLAMATWVGGLAMVLGSVLVRREPAEVRTVVSVFSSVAFWAVVLLVGSGTYSAWRGVGTWDALFSTTYGVLVVCKVVLLAAILAVAAFARRIVRRRAVAYAIGDTLLADEEDVPSDAEEPVRIERLRRAVYVETVVAFVVLAVSAVLVSEPRGREALLAAARLPVSASAQLGGGGSATVTVDPGTHGPVNVTVALSGGAKPVSVTVSAVQQQAQLGPLPIRLTRAAADVYEGNVLLPVKGTWEFDLVVTTSDFAATTTDVRLGVH